MGRALTVILLSFIGILPLEAQQYRASKVYLGLKGSLGCSFLDYSELHDEQQKFCLSNDAGVFLEWRLFDQLSVGFGFAYAYRKLRLEFNTPYLIDYSSVAVTNIAYGQSLKGLEWEIPLTWYLGRSKTWLDSYCRAYVSAGPYFFLILDGSIEWKRTHLIDNQMIDLYQTPISASSSYPFDFGAKAGFGIVYKQKVRHYFYLVKCDVSFYYGLQDTFSDVEKKLAVPHFYGLGDVYHETLGTRYFRKVVFSVSFSMPLREVPEGACRSFGVY